MRAKLAHPNLYRLTMLVAWVQMLIGFVGLITSPIAFESIFSVFYIILGASMAYYPRKSWRKTRTFMLSSVFYNFFWGVIMFVSFLVPNPEESDPVNTMLIGLFFLFLAGVNSISLLEPPFNPMTGDLSD